ncbi:hypothetical protein KsCSTR_31490 [Candidatus Kuenenia stuttgartiensis]|uniref:Uncharacterized protein n=1 Tax=Kuenenia stuttgartiensis TaxID=174633 RepID=A0A6G7GSH2_KUEST|nr:hypothetical protein KsCSTR_31490 [Candidatus Kuenenia stuttgartiensis]
MQPEPAGNDKLTFGNFNIFVVETHCMRLETAERSENVYKRELT